MKTAIRSYPEANPPNGRAGLPPPGRASRPRERGSAVIVVLVLLAIVLVYINGNLRTLHYLGRELRLIERQQTRRLEAAGRKAADRGKQAEAGKTKLETGGPKVEAWTASRPPNYR